jgi:hypothetical protein
VKHAFFGQTGVTKTVATGISPPGEVAEIAELIEQIERASAS